jgi:hypothetical protein
VRFPRRLSRVRASLYACHAEGATAEIFNACAGGAVVTAWALYLGAGAFTIGLLGALPLAAQLLQLPAAYLTRRFGPKSVTVIAVGGARVVWLPLAIVPLVDLPAGTKLHVFLGVSAVAAVLGVVGNNSWTAWMAELVPSRIRGRFFGRRGVFLSLAATPASLGAAVALDRLSALGARAEALAALAAAACLAGVASMRLLQRQHDSTPPAPRAPAHLSALLVPLRDPTIRPYLWYLLAWNAAVGVSASFASFHMLKNLQTSFALAAAHAIAVATVRVITAPVCGVAVDRLGAPRVLALSSFGVAAVPILWLLLTPERLWPLAVEALIAGVLWSAHGIATMQLLLALPPAAERPFYGAVFAATGGVGFAACSVLAGALATALPEQLPFVEGWGPLHLLFALSAVARLAASTLALGIEERGAARTRVLWRDLVPRRRRPAGAFYLLFGFTRPEYPNVAAFKRIAASFRVASK